MMKQPPAYVSYLLRLWQSGEGKDARWRALLESPLTGERHGFANLKDLFAFLDSLTSVAAHPEIEIRTRGQASAGSEEEYNPNNKEE